MNHTNTSHNESPFAILIATIHDPHAFYQNILNRLLTRKRTGSSATSEHSCRLSLVKEGTRGYTVFRAQIEQNVSETRLFFTGAIQCR